MTEGDIIWVKLVSGEELVARYVGTDKDTDWMKIIKPRVLVVQPTPDGQGMGVVMMPYAVGIPESNVSLQSSKIMSMNSDPLPKGLEDGYLQQTSGIQLAT